MSPSIIWYLWSKIFLQILDDNLALVTWLESVVIKAFCFNKVHPYAILNKIFHHLFAKYATLIVLNYLIPWSNIYWLFIQTYIHIVFRNEISICFINIIVNILGSFIQFKENQRIPGKLDLISTIVLKKKSVLSNPLVLYPICAEFLDMHKQLPIKSYSR